MYEKVATVTVSIEETVSLGEGKRSPDRNSYFPNDSNIYSLSFFHFSLEQKKTRTFADTVLKCEGKKAPNKTCSSALVTVDDLAQNKNIGNNSF